MLVIESAGMDVEKLRLFRLEVKNGHREVSGLSGVLGVLFKPGCLQRRVLF
jgi:hypothetical protein